MVLLLEELAVPLEVEEPLLVPLEVEEPLPEPVDVEEPLCDDVPLLVDELLPLGD